MRKVPAIVLAIVVAASCIPWLRHQPFFSPLVAITVIVLVGDSGVRGRACAICLVKQKHQPDSTQSGWWSPKIRNLSLGAALVVVLMLTVPHYISNK